MSRFEGQHALVTGGGRGIGRAVAAALTAEGVKVTILGRSVSHLKEAVSGGAAARYFVADATDEKQMAQAIAAAVLAGGPIDILVANAGAAESAPFLKGGAGIFRRMFDVNVIGVVHAIQGVLDGMVQRKSGRIVAVASIAGLKGGAYVSAYTASKHAVVGLVRSLALEVVSSGVTVNAVCPGYTDTDLVQNSVTQITGKTGRSRDDVIKGLLKHAPLGRLLKPAEVAAAVVYLCSAEAGGVTGAALPISGGEV